MNWGKTVTALAIAILTWTMISAQTAFAADFTVSSNSDCSLADAISAANSDQGVGSCGAGSGGDTIYVSGDITLSGNLPTVRSRITITSNDHAVKRVISGNNAFRIFNIEDGGNLTLQCLQLIKGRNHGMRGGAVRVYQGRAQLTDVRLEDNWAERGGGALRVGNGSAATCNKCQFVDNHSPLGGAIWVGDEGSSIVLNDSVVYNNSAERGGGMYIKHGRATIAGTTFSNNSAAEGPDLLSLDAEISIQPGSSIEERGIAYANG